MSQAARRETALAQAVLVTFLWSSSWVLIKVGLRDEGLDPLSFAGLRYALAAAILLPLAWPGLRRARPDRPALARVLVLGVLFYGVTQGAQFGALGLLPAAAVSLVLTATPAIVLLLGTFFGQDRPTALQVAGIVALVVGAALYFGPLDLGPAAAVGLAIAVVGTLANALSSVLGRSLALEATARLGGVLPLTALSMGLGALLLLGAGAATAGVPQLTERAWLIVGWLAVANTAFAFTLWNHTLRTLTAVESS
ncbi:MAG TPA: DMT family transporter, partial [Candidatus Limnocylindrales bacterium]|nr:DMT family transporter [Candidatus Limnocylindrales bacterium]